jgi:hypothetical protein
MSEHQFLKELVSDAKVKSLQQIHLLQRIQFTIAVKPYNLLEIDSIFLKDRIEYGTTV